MLRLRIGLADTAMLSRELGKEVTRYFRLYQWTFCPWWVYWTNIYNSSSLRCKENYKHLTESLPTPLTPYVHKFDHSLLLSFPASCLTDMFSGGKEPVFLCSSTVNLKEEAKHLVMLFTTTWHVITPFFVTPRPLYTMVHPRPSHRLPHPGIPRRLTWCWL